MNTATKLEGNYWGIQRAGLHGYVATVWAESEGEALRRYAESETEKREARRSFGRA